MIKKIENFFLSKYDQYSFVRQRLAKALLIFSFVLLLILISLFIIVPIFIPTNIKSAYGSLIAISFVFLITLVLLKKGYYYFAANFMTSAIIIVLIASLYKRTIEAPHAVYSTNLYFLMACIVLATLFCTRKWVISFSILIIINNIALFVLIKDKLTPQLLNESARPGMIYSILSIILATVLTQLIAQIFLSGMKKLKEEVQKNEDQNTIIKSLLNSAKGTSNQLSTLSNTLESASNTFSITTQSQAASVEEVTSSIEEISAGMDSMASSSEEQNGDLENLIAKMNELSTIIKDVGEISRNSLSLTIKTSGDATTGENSLKKMNNSLSKIVDSSKDISNIIGIINDISDKINLLSLNAAIEAARAGDAGKGFAVVADEISKLADQTASSIKEIDQFINANNDEINSGMADVVEVIETISTIIDNINAISDMMNKNAEHVEKQVDVNNNVNQQAERVKEQSHDINTSIFEQKLAIIEIVNSISDISEKNQITASESEKITDDISNLTNTMNQLDLILNTMSD